MQSRDLEELKGDAWRLNASTFAERISGGKWVAYSWVDFLLTYIQREVRKGGAKIIINAPPRHGKSEAISHWFPAWWLDWNPSGRVILGSYSDTFAVKWGLAVRDEFMPHKETLTRIRQDKSKAGDWQTTAGGGMRSVGAGGSVTGHGGDLVLIDDPHKDWAEAMSFAAREKVHDWIEGTIAPRLEPGGSIILMQTRWHEDDETGRLLSKVDEDWQVLRFPALSEGDGDMLGRTVNEALCPERYPAEVLEQIRIARGSYRWAGLYQQRPAPHKGGIVKREWFQRWTHGTIPSEAEWFLVIDPTQKSTGTSYFVAQVWAWLPSFPAKYWLVEQFRERVSFLESIKVVLRLKNQYPQIADVVVEESANGPAIIDTLKTNIPGLQPKSVHASKEARLIAVSGIVESGAVSVPAESDWVDGFISEVVTFPNAANDDQVDAMTLALSWATAKPTASFNFEIPMGGARANTWKEIQG